MKCCNRKTMHWSSLDPCHSMKEKKTVFASNSHSFQTPFVCGLGNYAWVWLPFFPLFLKQLFLSLVVSFLEAWLFSWAAVNSLPFFGMLLRVYEIVAQLLFKYTIGKNKCLHVAPSSSGGKWSGFGSHLKNR